MTKITAATVQGTPIPLNISAGIGAALEDATRAASDGAQLIGFGETYLGGYPVWLDEAPGAAMWDHPGTRHLHSLLLQEALVEGDERLTGFQSLADKRRCLINIGGHERRGGSLYNAQITFAPDTKPYWRRKLVPTHSERLIWARGDGSTLQVIEQAYGAVGGLICWEHWMPLARAAMHHQREVIHFAQWPTVQETYHLAARHYAFEGRCFVLSCGTILSKTDLLEGLASLGQAGAAKDMLESIETERLQHGGSAIIGPEAEILAGPGGDQRAVLTAELDLGRIGKALTSLDTAGHYARPDVFELRINTAAADGVIFMDAAKPADVKPE